MKRIAIASSIVLVIIIVVFLIHRYTSREELDDVHPLIMDTDDPYIKRSEWLWVIPLYMNVPISNYPEWIDRLKATGKKIGLHGVYHKKLEFGVDRSDEYIDKGIDEFTKAFGYYPTHFKAPGLALTAQNQKKFEERGIEIKGLINQLIYQVHHTSSHRRPNGWLLGE